LSIWINNSQTTHNRHFKGLWAVWLWKWHAIGTKNIF
jgi:hypothetical protein